ncbi:L-asparaginase [Tamaricihabitans halophyticus]|uniref:L-asparaginase n=1 Tax=Tamaricihabitans halophyticus TaxID=1262583 RepID=A0A4R2R924_9PSEU|nr:asparaginase domain-containing protein [Tamaricihabitans halophyticus]TCP56161.1 L-asparaginase [Tamaricihabitans halophyticus]
MTSRILLLATGDTIAYRHHTGQSTVASASELLAGATWQRRNIRVVPEDYPAEPSWDADPASTLRLASRVHGALTNEGFAGVLVTHGIDTLATAAFLSELLAGPMTTQARIVFTGAARCLDHAAGDARANLDDALTAVSDQGLTGYGAVICTAGQLQAARWAYLAEATGSARFGCATGAPVGRIADGRLTLTSPAPAPFPATGGDPTADVAVLKAYPGMPPAQLSTLADTGTRGIVLEGTGAGNVPVELFGTIADLSEKDIPVVIATRARTGGTPPDPDCGAGLASKLGAIIVPDLPPEQARCALQVALGLGGVAEVRDWFTRSGFC